MIDASKKLCLCGHTGGYHSGPSFAATYPHKAYWCCTGNWKSGRRRCKCPRFRLAIAQPSDRERIENADAT